MSPPTKVNVQSATTPHVHTYTTKVNVQSVTTLDSHSVTASDTWLSRYLVVDSTLGKHQALVHIVTVNCLKKFCGSNELQKFNTTKNVYANYF